MENFEQKNEKTQEQELPEGFEDSPRFKELREKKDRTSEEDIELQGFYVFDGHPRATELWKKRMTNQATPEEEAELLGLAEMFDDPRGAELIKKGALGQLSKEEEEEIRKKLLEKNFPEGIEKYQGKKEN